LKIAEKQKILAG